MRRGDLINEGILIKNRHPSDTFFSYVGAGGLMIKSKIFEELNGFDERFSPKFYEDPCLVWEAHFAGYKIGWNYHPVIIHRSHNLLPQDQKKYFIKSMVEFVKKWDGVEAPVFQME